MVTEELPSIGEEGSTRGMRGRDESSACAEQQVPGRVVFTSAGEPSWTVLRVSRDSYCPPHHFTHFASPALSIASTCAASALA